MYFKMIVNVTIVLHLKFDINQIMYILYAY